MAGGEVNGLDMSQRITQSVELYDSIADSWSYLPEMSVERYGCGCGVLADGAMIVVGGYGGKDRRAQQQQPPQLLQTVGTAEAGAPPPPSALSAGAAATMVGGFASFGGSVSATGAADMCPVATAPGAATGAGAVIAPPASLPSGGGLGRVRASGCACCAMFTSDNTKGSARGRHLHSAELLLDFGNGEGRASDWTWLPAPPLRSARKGFADVCFGEGMLVIGGVDTDGETLCSAEFLPPESHERSAKAEPILSDAAGEEEGGGDLAAAVGGKKFKEGARVAVVGLTGAAQHNGKEGTV